MRTDLLSNRTIIERAPLQIYYSALVFAHEKSIIRRAFEQYVPYWMQTNPIVQSYWNAALRTLEGHSGSDNSVAFSPGSESAVSGSWDRTVRLWDAEVIQYILIVALILTSRLRKVVLNEYARHLLYFHDGWFGRHPRWRFFLFNFIMRQNANASAHFYFRMAWVSKIPTETTSQKHCWWTTPSFL